MTSTGRLTGVGLGPGDPELITLKAARLIERADVIAYHAARHGHSIARSIAEAHLRDGQIEEALIYPVTTEEPEDHRGVVEEFYLRCAERLAAHLDAGRDVVVLCEGDPGSYMHLHRRLAGRYPAEVVPGVPSVSGASADLGRPLAERDEVLTVFPGTPPDPARTAVPGGGEVAVVGLGPAGREWLTPQAQDALAAADDLVGYGPYLDRVPADPRQRRHPTDNRQEADRAEFALGLAGQGRRVAVVSSGDPGVFAMATAVLEAAVAERWKDVPVRVLPGLTAAQAVASLVGAPLGHDYCVLSLSDRLKPWDVIAARLTAAAAADLVIAIYNPASRTRIWQLGKARDLLLAHRDPQTPVVIGRDAGGPAESVRVVPLAELDPAEVDMRCLLVIGSSQTQAAERGDGRTVVFTPRRYPA